ncbi:hypothetical protein J2Z35_001207 [Acetoanaerobium pronyense]|uniref:Uncharacterized protein n=1 Tax=Acetoanaerobium pronyense TaxID=1482736 RepID=A0ABS4KI43_9FIRM|nr:hypothetical protein [Acetoanaerobium pronyense]MBP2027413.1 hypothetical protein [Acetoanaerobium pronyense]
METKKVSRSRKTYQDRKETFNSWACQAHCGVEKDIVPRNKGTGSLFYMIPLLLITFAVLLIFL